MHEEAVIALRRLGKQLDAWMFPVVRNGGIVVPSEPDLSPRTLGTELKYVKPGKKGSEAGSTWASGRPRPFAWAWTWPHTGSGTPSASAPLVSAELRAKFANELTVIDEAYPGTQHWQDDDGMWLLVRSSLLTGISAEATFVIAVSFTHATVRGWGFWGSDAIGYEWIGPRHTNFPDGSICAFEPTDGTWSIHDPLVELLDIYTVWALRHLHLRAFGRWPGPQAVHFPYERQLELRPEECCGCSYPRGSYGSCCEPLDRERNQLKDALNFMLAMRGGLRSPSRSVVNFLADRSQRPKISDISM
jgi:hypothetical protein